MNPGSRWGGRMLRRRGEDAQTRCCWSPNHATTACRPSYPNTNSQRLKTLAKHTSKLCSPGRQRQSSLVFSFVLHTPQLASGRLVMMLVIVIVAGLPAGSEMGASVAV